MKNLIKVLNDFKEKLINLKYEYAVSLLDLLSDEEYVLLCEEHKDLFLPIQEEHGNEYLHRPDILDSLIDLFIQCLEQPNPIRMDKEELVKYIVDLLPTIEEVDLRTVAININKMLED